MAHRQVPLKTKTTTIKLTLDQHKLIVKKAKQCGVRLGPWIRSIILQAAVREVSEGYMRIREPNGSET